MKQNNFKPKTLILRPYMFQDNDAFETVCNALGIPVEFNDDGETNVLDITCYVLNTTVDYDESIQGERHPSLSDSERNPTLGRK